MRLLGLLLLLLAASTSTLALAAGREITPEDRYELCLKYMGRAYYTKALEQCNRVRNYHRDDPVSVKAELAIADIHYKKGDYEQARLAYEDFARLHPRHPDLDYVVYRVGMSIYKRAPRLAGRDQTATRQAVNVWTGYRTRFPDSPYVDEVEEYWQRSRNRLATKELYIARFYARRGTWSAARDRAEGLLKRYPDSEPAPEALALVARSQHAWGDVEGATQTRGRLASEYPESRELVRLDRHLGKTPGEPPEEQIFTRPYRYPGMTMPGMGAY